MDSIYCLTHRDRHHPSNLLSAGHTLDRRVRALLSKPPIVSFLLTFVCSPARSDRREPEDAHIRRAIPGCSVVSLPLDHTPLTAHLRAPTPVVSIPHRPCAHSKSSYVYHSFLQPVCLLITPASQMSSVRRSRRSNINAHPGAPDLITEDGAKIKKAPKKASVPKAVRNRRLAHLEAELALLQHRDTHAYLARESAPSLQPTVSKTVCYFDSRFPALR
jgi:hypothetical protein